ncbi:MAG: hypothetical protein ACXVOH_01785 [Bacteroidia bacterium]
MAFIGGFALMSVELIYPRISSIWFGNTLVVWAVDLSLSLAVIAMGYFSGSFFLKINPHKKNSFLSIVYIVGAAWFFITPHFYNLLLESLLNMNETASAVIFGLVFMIPTMGILAFTSPLLIASAQKNIVQENAASFIFGISTFGGALATLFVGLYFIPYLGILNACYFSGALLLFNFGIALRFKPLI